jgi:acyl-[acyl-carrier-protein] desaturase
LLASGHRTEEQRESFEKELLEAEWELPFDHPREMLCYTMIQELATFWNYRNLEKMATQQKDWALVGALRLISVDERVHYNFYRNSVKEWMKYDEAGTVEDLKYVFEHFTMPGKSQIPRYDESARVLAQTGIYGPREYVKLVKNPILEDLKLDKEFRSSNSAKPKTKLQNRQKSRLNVVSKSQSETATRCPKTIRL